MSGPERLDRFMARANAAYYAQSDPFADFTTAPEISQVFGELLGAWVVVVWRSMGAPARFVLAEAGPGRGTLIADTLRLIGRVAPDCRDALSLALIETSQRLRGRQEAALAAVHDRPVLWLADSEALPPGPLILLANEFLDALPIRQFRREEGGWSEHHVLAGRSHWLPAIATAELLDGEAAAALEVGGIAELCEPALRWIRWLDARLAGQGGAALLLDYGPETPAAGDSLQALRGGAVADPLACPGSADLTAHVDFPRLCRVVRRTACHGPVPQGRLLSSLGLFERTARLAQGREPALRRSLYEAAHRLADPGRMGHLFKAVALCHPGLPAPPGFEASAAVRRGAGEPYSREGAACATGPGEIAP